MASYFALPAALQASYVARDAYPKNLIQKTVTTYPSALEAYVNSINAAAKTLFETDPTLIDVKFRDLQTNDGAGKAVEKTYVYQPEKLTECLGLQVAQDPQDPQRQIISGSSKDPKCRFICIYGISSRARLNITRAMLMEILTFHQVMPEYLDFMSIFGLQEVSDLKFGSFRTQSSLKPSSEKYDIGALGRSGRQYQFCYNLKAVSPIHRDPKHPYSIRQSAFYHRFDVVNGNSLWIVTKGGLDLQERFKELTGKEARTEDKSFTTPLECFRSSLSAHLMFCHWSTENWKDFIKCMEITIDKDADMVVLGPRGDGHHHRIYTGENIQELHKWHEEVSEIITVLESNIDVLTAMMHFYLNLQKSKHFPLRDTCSDDVDDFVSQLDNIIVNFKMQISRARKLLQRTMERSELVKQHLATQSSEKLERLNRHMENEATKVGIITLVTLFYLPATFASTFFSTDIVKYQGTENGTFSYIAMVRWLQVALPLTFVTLVVSYLLNRRAERKAQGIEVSSLRQARCFPWRWNQGTKLEREVIQLTSLPAKHCQTSPV